MLDLATQKSWELFGWLLGTWPWRRAPGELGWIFLKPSYRQGRLLRSPRANDDTFLAQNGTEPSCRPIHARIVNDRNAPDCLGGSAPSDQCIASRNGERPMFDTDPVQQKQ